MDELLPQLLSFPPHPQPAQKILDVDYDRQIKALVKLLNGTNAGKLIKGVPGGGDLLDVSHFSCSLERRQLELTKP